MNTFLVLAFLFFIGSTLGWIMELIFRNIVHKTNHIINPGFCTGPYLPIYGFGLCTLFLIAFLEDVALFENQGINRLFIFVLMAIAMTLIEYIAGLFLLKVFKVRLWDYSDIWGNVNGLICPLFSVIWAIIGGIYYFFIHHYVYDALYWFSNNLGFSFFIGLFFGFLIIDVVHSSGIIAKLKKYADENDVVVRYESIKDRISERHDRLHQKYHFFNPFKSELPFNELLKELSDKIEHINKGE